MKRIIRRVLSLVLVLCMFGSASSPTFAATYSDSVSEVMDRFRSTDSKVNLANDQVLNGRYRTVELLDIIARELDTDGKYSKDIKRIMDEYNKKYSKNTIHDQIANGACRTAELLGIIAKELDKNGIPIEKVTMVNEWKCPYHNGRMALEVMTRL